MAFIEEGESPTFRRKLNEDSNLCSKDFRQVDFSQRCLKSNTKTDF